MMDFDVRSLVIYDEDWGQATGITCLPAEHTRAHTHTHKGKECGMPIVILKLVF